jgi:hypothetical protein
MRKTYTRVLPSIFAAAIMGIASSGTDRVALASTLSQYIVPAATTGPTPVSSCGPYYNSSSTSNTLYCASISFGSSGVCTSSPTLSSISIGGGNTYLGTIGSNTVYGANAGFPSTFLNVTWDAAGMWVTSLVASAQFTLFVWC